MKLNSCAYLAPWTTESQHSIWAYLLENGDVDPKDKTRYCLEQIRDIGINWDATRMPVILDRSNEMGKKEVRLNGILTLNDWTWFNWVYIIEPPNTSLNSTTELKFILSRRLKE